MYHFFVRRHLRLVMSKLNAGDFAFVRKQFARRATHWFAGSHSLSGERRTPEAIAAWYARLATVFPGIRFTVRKVAVSGPPWDTEAAIEWTDEVQDRSGSVFPNEGVFTLRLRWGKATEFRVFCDTKKIENVLGLLTKQGVNEACAEPIVG